MDFRQQVANSQANLDAGLEAAMKRLRWRCRRGMKELDALLVRWLDAHYKVAGPAERTAFERLLECEDDRIWKWFLGREPAPDRELQGIVERIVHPD